MKASLKGRYEVDKSSAAATLFVATGDVRFKASITDATVVKGPSLSCLSLSVEKPGSFIIDYNVPKQDVQFHSMDPIRLLEKQVNLTYTHDVGDSRMALDTTAVINPANKVSASYAFRSGNCKVKYVYAHGETRRTMLELCYDVSKNIGTPSSMDVSRDFHQ